VERADRESRDRGDIDSLKKEKRKEKRQHRKQQREKIKI